MKIAKRVLLFVSVNLLIVATLSILTQVLGIQPYLSNKGIHFNTLIIFCLIWGFGGAFLSLALSRVMAKWMMGVRLVTNTEVDPELRRIYQKVHELSRRAGLSAMPEVGVYESDDRNAFATGPTKSRSLVAVSSGLIQKMNRREVDGVLAHEVAHIANGDMVTMTLLQGVVNAFVMFLARLIGNLVSQFVDEEKRTMVQFGVVFASELLLGILGMLIVSAFSRAREFRADAGGAQLAGRETMILALEALQMAESTPENELGAQPLLASLKISGKSGGFLRWFSTHPPLEDRIHKLQIDAHRF